MEQYYYNRNEKPNSYETKKDIGFDPATEMSPATSTVPQISAAPPKIAVYAGHGGSDYGAVANGLYEKDFNLALSNGVTKILREKGYEVINNRTTDVNRDINADVAMANRLSVNGVVDIHMNSNLGTPGSGTGPLTQERLFR